MERELCEPVPVVGAELREGAGRLGPGRAGGSSAVELEEAELVVTQDGEGVVLAGEVDHASTVGASVNEVAEEEEPVVAGGGEAGEEVGKLGVAAVDVADSDEASVHGPGFVLASGRRGRKPKRHMDLQLQSLSPRCAVSAQAFVDGERVTSFLSRDPARPEEVVRADVRAAQAADYAAPGLVVCRWTHVFKARRAAENPERELKLTAEALFLSLADPATERTEENERMLQVLGLMLERKRVVRPRGRTGTGAQARLTYEHVKTKALYEVAGRELTPEFFLSIQEQLAALVGGGGGGVPEKPDAPAV
jgi:hypothetical protein